MDIISILFTIIVILLYRLFFGKKHAGWTIFFLSILALFYYQPISSIKNYDFWVPSISLMISVLSWMLVSKQSIYANIKNRIAIGSLILIFFLFAILRFFPQIKVLHIISIPPQLDILIFIITSFFLILIFRNLNKKIIFYQLLIFLLISFFVLQKNQFLALKTSGLLRKLSGQTTSLSNASEIIWIGYSYFAFRLLHVLIDTIKMGKVDIGLHEFIGYLFFFPALLAGPIMRREDYVKELGQIETNNDGTLEIALQRISIGLFQKFILADMLALISMNSSNVKQISSPGWMWFFVIMYTFRIFFDFSGYTHIAIGIAKLIGINLPENFNKPLRSPNLTIFWNKWHITLTQWFRVYYFNPLTRYFRRNSKDINPNIILAFMQLSTMILIGLWHGISWNFIFWGSWVGIGLFVQNLSSTWFIKKFAKGTPFWQLNRFTKAVSISATFLYISLGWVWFAMPDLNTSLDVFAALVGK